MALLGDYEALYGLLPNRDGMTHRNGQSGVQRGLLDDAADYGRNVIAGKYAMQGINNMNSLMDRAVAGDTQAALELGMQFTPGAIGTVAGKMAKTADLKKLFQAEAMEKAGNNADDVFKATGWWKGPDQQWRFEIDDSLSRFGDRRGSIDTLVAGQQINPLSQPKAGYAIRHEELKAAYPDTMDIGLDLTAKKGGGHYSPKRFPEPEQIALGDRNKSTMLHELQHAIQEREGFARGGSSSGGVIFKGGERDALIQAEFDRLASIYRNPNPMNPYASAMKDISDSEMWQRAAKAVDDDLWRYKHLAGEVEARTVQKRMNLTPEERMARPFWLDYDVPVEQQIIRTK